MPAPGRQPLKPMRAAEGRSREGLQGIPVTFHRIAHPRRAGHPLPFGSQAYTRRPLKCSQSWPGTYRRAMVALRGGMGVGPARIAAEGLRLAPTRGVQARARSVLLRLACDNRRRRRRGDACRLASHLDCEPAGVPPGFAAKTGRRPYATFRFTCRLRPAALAHPGQLGDGLRQASAQITRHLAHELVAQSRVLLAQLA